MAQEQFSNDAITTLAAAINSTDQTSIEVTDSTLFPSEPQFRIRIEDELLLVTAVDGTADQEWTVERGAEDTTAATHDNGTDVNHVLTAGAINQVVHEEFVYNEVPTGTIDSSNQTYTLENDFVDGTTRVYLNGIRQTDGTSNDYTESSPDIIFNSPPVDGDVITVDYRAR